MNKFYVVFHWRNGASYLMPGRAYRFTALASEAQKFPEAQARRVAAALARATPCTSCHIIACNAPQVQSEAVEVPASK